MRKLYDKFFFVPEEGKGKVSEKVLIARIAATVLLVILSLAQMSFSAVAHFLGTGEIKTRHIITAAYDIDCAITSEGQTVTAKKITAADADIYPRTYEITLDLDSENTASTGFCIVEVYYTSTAASLAEGEVPAPDHVYYTAQLGKDDTAQGGKRDTLTFTLELTAPATIRLVPSWGVSAHYGYDINNEELFVEDGDVIIPPEPIVVNAPENAPENVPENNSDRREPDAFGTGDSTEDTEKQNIADN